MEKYITFSVLIKKECDNSNNNNNNNNNSNNNNNKKNKQLPTNLNYLIVLDLCQLHYQNLLVTHLEFLIV